MAILKTVVRMSHEASVSVSTDAHGYFAQVGDWYVEERDGNLVVRSARLSDHLLTVLVVPLERHAD